MRHSTVNFKFLEWHSRIRVHCVEDFGALERRRLFDGAGDVSLGDIASQSHNCPARIRTPVGGEEP